MGDHTKKSKDTAAGTKPAGLTRRTLLKGTTAAAGLVAGTAAMGGFPTVWAQEDITINHSGMS